MFTPSKQKSLVGLDIEAGSIAAAEVSSNGRVEVHRYGIAPLEPGVFREGEVTDTEALASSLKELFSRHKLPRNVRLGVANQRVAVRTLHLPPIENAEELETAIRFQAQDHIPMPLDQAVLDWEVVGHRTTDAGERRIEVVAVAGRRDMLASVTDALDQAGLRPVGVDLSAFGMIRALAREPRQAVGAAEFVSAPVPYEERYGADAPPEPATETTELATGAQLYCNLGDVVNLAVAQGTSCLFSRISPFGIEGIAQRLAERRRLTLEHARQWLVHVGLERPHEEIEGNAETVEAAREALDEGAAKLVDELRLSLEFYGAQEQAVAVDGVVVCGPGSTIPGLVERLQRDLGFPFQTGAPQALSHLDQASAARLTLSYGLALEG
ncbi:MAG: pilus assembly protein PilM [Solirubrobacterales bacterium]